MGFLRPDRSIIRYSLCGKKENGVNLPFLKKREKNGKPANGRFQHGNAHLIELRQVTKTYKTAAGGYTALKDIDITIDNGEFVGVIGKSGSGKSTLINMITGIDRPTGGEVLIGDTAVHRLSENQMARWRGRNVGIVFQFFQLLPTLSVIENIMLPMDFCATFPLRERKKRAMQLLELVDMGEHAYKLPSAVSGGQQQRVAIARALANDPPIVIADEPTGNLDSKTADSVFAMFERLASEGKTIVMVTHDSSLARRVSRTVIIADGEVVNEYLARAMPSLTPQQMIEASRKARPMTFSPGATIIHEGTPGEYFYVIRDGVAEVALRREGGADVVAARMGPGQSFGEISMFHGRHTAATVRVVPEGPLEALAFDKAAFDSLLDESPTFREAMRSAAHANLIHNEAVLTHAAHGGQP
jgi:ABC-type lipoprotein export system ATPase subunit